MDQGSASVQDGRQLGAYKKIQELFGQTQGYFSFNGTYTGE